MSTIEALIDVSGAKIVDGQRRFELNSSLDTQAQELVDPFDEVQDALLRWYLEEHPTHDPLEKTRASLAETELKRYGRRVAEEIGLSRVIPDSDGETLVKIRQQGDPSDVSGHALHWEALECLNDKRIPDNDRTSPVVVSRLVTPAVDCQLEVPHQEGTNPFRILLVVARQNLSESDHRIVSTTLRRIAAAMGSDRIEIDMVRPGTFTELKNQLQLCQSRSRRIDLVHFDVHGEVKTVQDEQGCARFESYLRFFPQNEGGSGLRKASDIASLLRKHHVPMIVVNACESARSDRGPLANLAHVFVRNGIPMVLAMSYKLQVDALSVFFGSFYDSFLRRGRDFSESAADGRKAMRLNKKRRGSLGLELNLLDWIVPTTYIASGLNYSSIRAATLFEVPVPIISPSCPSTAQQMEDVDPRFDTEVLNVETRLFDPWRCGAGPIVNICGFDGIGKRSFLRHCQQWWTETSLFDRILTYASRRGEAYPPAGEILAWMASQLEPGKQPSDIESEDIVLGWLGPRRCRKRLLVILENFSVFRVDNGIPNRALSLLDEREWHGLFEWMRAQGIWVVVSSVSKLALVIESPSADDEEHLFPVEPIKFRGGQDTPVTSPYYYLPGVRNAIAQAGKANDLFSSLTNIEDLAALKALVDCLAGLTGKPPAAVVSYFISGRDPFRQSADYEQRLRSAQPVFSLLEGYYAHQGGLAKAILFGLSLFSKYLGRKLEVYCTDFVVRLGEALSSFSTTRLKGDTSSGSTLPSWPMELASELRPGSASATRSLICDCLRHVIRDLMALGVLRKDFFFFEEPEGSDQTSEQRIPTVPLYRPHPCLTLFLRRQFAKDLAQISPDNACVDATILETEKSFIRYHRSRLEAWPAVATSGAVFSQISQSDEEREERLNFLGAMEMWLEEGFDHHDYSYPKRLFNQLSRPFPSLTKNIPPNELAPYVVKIQGRLSRVYQDLDRQSTPPPQQQQATSKLSQAIRRLNLFQRHHELADASERRRVRTRWQYYAAFAFYLRLGNWLSYYYVIHGKPESAARQIHSCCSAVSTHLTPYRRHETIASLLPLGFPGTAGLRRVVDIVGPPKLAQELYMINSTTGLKNEEQLILWASGLLQRSRSVTLQTWVKSCEQQSRQFDAFRSWLFDTDDEETRRWATIGTDMLKKGWEEKRSAETWGYRTREEVEEAKMEDENELRRGFIALAGTPESYFNQLLDGLRKARRLISRQFDSPDTDDNPGAEESQVGGLEGFLASLFGVTTDEEREETLELMRAVPGLDELIRIWDILKRAFGELREGVPPGRIFDDVFPQLKLFHAQFWRRFLVWALNFGMQENEVFKLVSTHQLLIKDYLDRCDWEGLNEHLHNIDLDAEQGGKCQWYAVQGICSTHLKNWDEAGKYLTKSLEQLEIDSRDEFMLSNFGIFGLAGAFTIQFTLLRFMIAVKYEAGDECNSAPMPAWRVFLEAMRMGYGAPIGLLYRWNGSILEQLLQHYLEPPGPLRDAERVIQLPGKENYCTAIKAYGIPIDMDNEMDIMDIPEQQRHLYLLLEFLHYKKAQNELDYELLGNSADSTAFFRYYTNPSQVPKAQLSRNSASVVFLSALQHELSEQWDSRLSVMETFEKFLMGKSVAGVPERLARMSTCPVLQAHCESVREV